MKLNVLLLVIVSNLSFGQVPLKGKAIEQVGNHGSQEKRVNELDSITYHDLEVLYGKKEKKNIIEISSYQTKSGDWIKVGDTLVFGKPSNPANLSASSNFHINGFPAPTIKHSYIYLGSLTQAILNLDDYADQTMIGNEIYITKIRVVRMGAKQPYYAGIEFKKVGGGTFNYINSKGHANLEFALESGEIIKGNFKPSREDAIKKLMEAKFLLDMDIIKTEEFESIKRELTPIIRNN